MNFFLPKFVFGEFTATKIKLGYYLQIISLGGNLLVIRSVLNQLTPTSVVNKS